MWTLILLLQLTSAPVTCPWSSPLIPAHCPPTPMSLAAPSRHGVECVCIFRTGSESRWWMKCQNIYICAHLECSQFFPISACHVDSMHFRTKKEGFRDLGGNQGSCSLTLQSAQGWSCPGCLIRSLPGQNMCRCSVAAPSLLLLARNTMFWAEFFSTLSRSSLYKYVLHGHHLLHHGDPSKEPAKSINYCADHSKQ